jgi:hypothetical protein
MFGFQRINMTWRLVTLQARGSVKRHFWRNY